MTEKTNEANELEFDAYEISDAFSQVIQEEIQSASKMLVESDENLSEEDVKTFGDTFEAAVRATTKRLLNEEVVPHYESQLETLVESVKADLSDNINDYLEYVVEEFINENKEELVVSETAKHDRAIVEGLVGLMQENYVEVPEERKDLIEGLNEELKQTRGEVDTLEEELIQLRKQVKGARCDKIFTDLSEGLTETQKEKFLSLVEDLSISDVALFEEKATKIRNDFFKKAGKEEVQEESHVEEGEVITEEVSEGSDSNESPATPDWMSEVVRLGSVSKRSGFSRKSA